MLVLSRRQGEQILIGADIIVTVIAVDRGKVRLGFSAPKDTWILRSELVPITDGGHAATDLGDVDDP